MTEDPFHRVARRELAPLMEDVPDGPTWDELAALAGTAPRRWWPPRSVIVGSVAVMVLVVLGAVPMLLGDGPEASPPTPDPSQTVSPAEPTVTPIPLDRPISLQVLAIRPNNLSLAVLDLEGRATTIYPPGAHALPLDGTDGAVMTPNREWIIWSSGVARLFSGPLDRVDVELGPNPPRAVSGFTPALRVVPTPQTEQAWLVQPGIGYGTHDHPTLVELIPIAGGSPFLSLEADAADFPVAATGTGLVLNTHRWFDTGDGFTAEPGSELVVHLLANGIEVEIGEGTAIAASPTKVARLACPADRAACDLYLHSNRLIVSSPDGTDQIEVSKDFDGSWRSVGGPGIPSDAMPLQTVSPDGSELLISLGRDLDVNGSPAYSVLLAIDLLDGTTRTIAELDEDTSTGTWSSDGEWIALLGRDDIRLVNANDPAMTILLEEVIPPGHFPLAAG